MLLDLDDIEDVDVSDGVTFYRYITYESTPFLERYMAVRDTPQGRWLVPERVYHIGASPWRDDQVKATKRWAGKDTVRMFAYPTKREALDSYLHRREHYLGHLARRRENAEESICKAERLRDRMGGVKDAG